MVDVSCKWLNFNYIKDVIFNECWFSSIYQYKMFSRLLNNITTNSCVTKYEPNSPKQINNRVLTYSLRFNMRQSNSYDPLLAIFGYSWTWKTTIPCMTNPSDGIDDNSWCSSFKSVKLFLKELHLRSSAQFLMLLSLFLLLFL